MAEAAQAGDKEASAVSEEEARRFWLARTALRSYLVVKDELHWRVQNLYKRSDAFTKAVEGLRGMGDFQSCADECAFAFARAHGRDAFAGLGLEHWMDVFYGEAWKVESRTDEWSEKLHLTLRVPSEDVFSHRRLRGARSWIAPCCVT